MTKLSTLLLLSITSVAACAVAPEEQGDDSGDNGGGTGDGNGDGSGGRPTDDGDGDGDGSGTGGGATSGASALDDINEAECEIALACQSSWSTEYGDFAEYYGTDQASCVQLGADYYNIPGIAAAIANGTINVNTADAAECTAAVAALGTPDCAGYFENGLNLPEACSTFLTGTVAAGGACTVSEECAAGYCGDAGTCQAAM